MKTFEWTDATPRRSGAQSAADRRQGRLQGRRRRPARPDEGAPRRADAPGQHPRRSRASTGSSTTTRPACTIGPLVTLAQLDERPDDPPALPALADAAGHAATPQIRNMATLGGNLLQRPRCWYFRNEQFHCRKKGGETCFAQDGENQYHAIFDNGLCAIVHPSAAAVALVALRREARADAAGKGKREVTLEEFFVLPNVDVHAREHARGRRAASPQIRVPAPAPARESSTSSRARRSRSTGRSPRSRWSSSMDGETC